MKKLLPLLAMLLVCNAVFAQTPVPMATQPGLTYTEDFSDISNWTNGFASGIGANRFGGLPVNSSGAIPDGVKITALTTSFVTMSAGGVQRGTDQATPLNSLILLSAGTTDNSSATAVDLYLNFTAVNAGNLSFDYAVVNNSTGNRKSTLRVYSTIDGTNFITVPGAIIQNFTNNVPLSGTVSVALPASFNNNPNARLRFYYNNGDGGTTGSRPKLSIDNISVTAIGSPCVNPTGQATNLALSNVTAASIDGSFTAAAPSTEEYLVVMSNNSSLTSNPVNGTAYNVGDGLGDGTVISRTAGNSFTATNLSAASHYYFFVFATNTYCNGGPLYNIVSPAINDTTTGGGQPPCAAPTAQPTALSFGSTTQSVIAGSFAATTADDYLVIRSIASTLSSMPVSGQTYSAGSAIGNGTVVQSGSNTSFTATGLAANTHYYFFIFSYNGLGCNNGPVYFTTAPLTGDIFTQPLPACSTPLAQPTNLTFTITNTTISGAFTISASADNYLIIQSTSPTLASLPADNTNYLYGDNIGGGTVIANTNSLAFISGGLNATTTYYYFLFSSNSNCTGGIKYLSASPLTGNATTNNLLVNNYYFGNLHSHSDYSDGNKDNPAYTPADDYLYAMSSLCLDYLGISEHNHYTANNNPGTKITNYHLGPTQANNFTASHPGFLALYGMEWGVISGGGHVIVYGDGMDQLFGWETGGGSWGTSNNYDVFVAKSDYTGTSGLFKTINDRSATNTFATLAHPNSSDYNNLAGTAYSSVADDAVVGSAVESGPALSTNTSYTDPASSLSYLSYYQKLLAKGYHLGPTIDHDNHNTTFGRTTHSRTAIIAPSLTKADVIKAMKDMHFYATQDCDTKVDFTINTKMMGSIFTGRYAPNIAVSLTDATTSLTNATINVMYGVPGSNTNAVQLYSTTGSSLNFTDNNLANFNTGYYYIDISNAGSRIITAPIWYTRIDNGVLPVTLSLFSVQKNDDQVKLVWSTSQEQNSASFIVEHSVDGQHWIAITALNAAGNSSIRNNYTAYDYNPANGINYYRLKQVNKDNGFEYSVVRSVLFNIAYKVVVAPNPAKDIINLYLNNNNATANVLLTDAAGSIIYNTTTTQSHTAINAAGLSKGLYFIKVSDKYQSTVLKVMLQ